MFEILGKIKLVQPIQYFSSGFTKREFVLTTTDSKYPQDIKFELVKDKCSLAENLAPDDLVTVFFDIRGNEFNSKYYVNLNCWKLEKQQHSITPLSQQSPSDSHFSDDDSPHFLNEEPADSDLSVSNETLDDLPF